MANITTTMTNQMMNSGMTRWFPGLYRSVQLLFNVGHAFVLRKLLLLLCPFIQRGQGSAAAAPPQQNWGAMTPGGEPMRSTIAGPDGMKALAEEPDLYIPLMSYITYVVLYGIQRGTLSDFSPDDVASSAASAFYLWVFEVAVAQIAFYIAGSSISTLDVVANSGYKFVHLMVMVLLRTMPINNYVYYPFFLYFAACAAFATRRFMLFLQTQPKQQPYGGAVATPGRLHTHIVLAMAVWQIPLCWLLTPSST